jgi:hypothetical protein
MGEHANSAQSGVTVPRAKEKGRPVVARSALEHGTACNGLLASRPSGISGVYWMLAREDLGRSRTPALFAQNNVRPDNESMGKQLYMVVERFKNKDAVPVYRRFRVRGRMAPEGLTYISSWVDCQLERCYQIMEANDPALLNQWMANWSDIVDFEIYPVITSQKAAEMIAPRL